MPFHLSVCLSVKIVDFCKVYWSPLFVCLSVRLFVCLSVCLFVCLSVCTVRHMTSPIFLKIRQLMYSVPRTLAIFLGKNRIKRKVKVTTFVKIIIVAITFEPKVVQTSGWLQNVILDRTALSAGRPSVYDVRRHVLTSRDFKENEGFCKNKSVKSSRSKVKVKVKGHCLSKST